MRKFMKIVESITHNEALNQRIEDKLTPLSSEDRTKVRDGLEVIMNASGGLNVKGWVLKMRELWPAADNAELKRVFQIMTGDFSDLLNRKDDGYYVFASTTPVSSGELDTTSHLAQAASAQIAATHSILGIMRELGTFSAHDVEDRFAANYGAHPEMAHMLVQHVIDQSAATVKPSGAGMYHWEEPTTKTGLSFLKDLEGYQPRA